MGEITTFHKENYYIPERKLLHSIKEITTFHEEITTFHKEITIFHEIH